MFAGKSASRQRVKRVSGGGFYRSLAAPPLLGEGVGGEVYKLAASRIFAIKSKMAKSHITQLTSRILPVSTFSTT